MSIRVWDTRPEVRRIDWNSLLPLLEASDYTIAREVILRGVAALYFIAFLSSFNQFPALLGDNGLSPAPQFLKRLLRQRTPSLFNWRTTTYSDRLLRSICVIGMLLSISVVAGGVQLGPAWVPIPVFLLMWWLYMSIVSIGQQFYGFGWESLILETGFIVGFLGTPQVAPPMLILLFLRWTLFRVEFGAGMIKMRSDNSWRDLTAMDYHHQTQPMPNPLSRWAHRKPPWWHRSETLGSHIIQLVMPWLLFFPQPIASIGATIIIFSQLALVITGNYAWLNWITILIAFSGISDSFLKMLVGGGWPGWGGNLFATVAEGNAQVQSPVWWFIVIAVVFIWLVVLSWLPLRNLFSSRQLMNASFNRWHLVNAYGAFGSMTQMRRELIIEGTLSTDPATDNWHAYEFKGKPGDVFRKAPQVAPYHLRLDWMMWFLALGSWRQAWFSAFLEKILDGDPQIRRLLRTDSFDGQAPELIRVRVFEYRYTTRQERQQTGQWWWREELGTLVSPSGLE